MAQTGLPSSADLLIFMDKLGAWLKREVSRGTGLSGDTTSAAYYAQQVRTYLFGDGASIYGLSNAALQGSLQSAAQKFVRSGRYDVGVNVAARELVNTLDQYVVQNQPSGWNLGASGLFGLDALLTYYNATASATPETPAGTLAVAATTGGALAEVASGSAPRVKCSWVGAYDVNTSLPCAASAQVALASPNNAYVLSGLSGNVPTGVTKLRVYRQEYGAGSGDPYYWLKDVTVTAGTAVSVYMSGGASPVTLTEPDTALNKSVQPPSYASALAIPEFATLYALCYATTVASQAQQPLDVLMTLLSQGMLSPRNVALNPWTLHLGYQNPATTGELSRWTATAIADGTIQAANDPTRGLQGFAGAANGLQARTLTTLNGTAAISDIDYTYIDSTHQTAQNGTITGPVSLTATVGDTADLGVPAGRIVLSVTDYSVATATTGSFTVEAIVHRAL